MPTLAERLDRISFDGSTLEALPYDDIRAALAEHTIVRVRGLFDRGEMRVLYNPIFADDVLGMRAHFVKLARFRNLLYKAPIDFAVPVG